MSWDVTVLHLREKLESVGDLNDENTLPLGAASDVREAISAALPTVDWSDPTWGGYLGEGFSIEFNMGNDDPIQDMMLHVRGGGDAISAIMRFVVPNGWVALDCSTSEFLDPANPSDAGWADFQELRDQVRSGLRADDAGAGNEGPDGAGNNASVYDSMKSGFNTSLFVAHWLQTLAWVSIGSMIVWPIIFRSVHIDFSPIFLFWAASAIKRRSRSARRWVLGLGAVGLTALTLMLLWITFAGTGRVFVDPGPGFRRNAAVWEIALAAVSFAALICIPMIVLMSQRARRQFGCGAY